MKKIKRDTIEKSSSRYASAGLAERRIAITIAQSPAVLPGIAELLDAERLGDETNELVGLITEYPKFCDEVGPSVVAENTGLPEPIVRYFAWLELTPAAELHALPTLEQSIEILAERPFELLGALAQWRDELKRGIGGQRADSPGTWRRDALYIAACHEQAAIEAERAGDRVAALDWIEKAAWALAGEAASQRRSA
jgi:hypothetical protein